MVERVARFVIPEALSLLPEKMDTPEAHAMLLAIGLQESRFEHRVQVGGPARGFWQFELGGGVKGVKTHKATAVHLKSVLEQLQYFPDLSVPEIYAAIEHNDILACCVARLLLYTLPGSLAKRTMPDLGWDQYTAAWRPGKPHAQTWAEHFRQAWGLVDAHA